MNQSLFEIQKEQTKHQKSYSIQNAAIIFSKIEQNTNKVQTEIKQNNDTIKEQMIEKRNLVKQIEDLTNELQKI